MHRVDGSAPATMYRGGMLNGPELAQLRQIPPAVRLGRVRRIEADRIRLDGGDLPTGPEVLHVDCTARGLRDSTAVPIFSPGRIVLQQVRHNSPPFNAALIGFVEAHRSDDQDRNRLCPPNPFARDHAGYPRLLARTWRTEGSWLREPDLSRWMADSRLNLLAALARHQQQPRAVEAVTRYLTHVGDAVQRLGSFAAPSAG